jgi:hypothetical protein
MSAKMRAVVCAAISGEYFAFQREIRRVTSDMIRLLSGLRAGVSTVRTSEVVEPVAGPRGLQWY